MLLCGLCFSSCLQAPALASISDCMALFHQVSFIRVLITEQRSRLTVHQPSLSRIYYLSNQLLHSKLPCERQEKEVLIFMRTIRYLSVCANRVSTSISEDFPVGRCQERKCSRSETVTASCMCVHVNVCVHGAMGHVNMCERECAHQVSCSLSLSL